VVHTRLAARELSFKMSFLGRNRRTSFIAELNISCGGCTGGTLLKLPVIGRPGLLWRLDCWLAKLGLARDRAFCIAWSSCEADFIRATHVLHRLAPRGTIHARAPKRGDIQRD
jgi:hypothetical protein